MLELIRRGRLTVHTLLVGIVAVSAAYWATALFVHPFLLNDVLDGSLIVLCCVVTYQYLNWSMAHLGAIADRQMTIRAGIVLGWAATGVWRIERFLLQERAFGYVGPVAADPLRGFMISLLALGAIYHILAFDMDDPGRPKRSNTMLCAGSIIMGSGFVLILRLG